MARKPKAPITSLEDHIRPPSLSQQKTLTFAASPFIEIGQKINHLQLMGMRPDAVDLDVDKFMMIHNWKVYRRGHQ